MIQLGRPVPSDVRELGTKQGRPKKGSNTTFIGRGANYTLARLKRDSHKDPRYASPYLAEFYSANSYFSRTRIPKARSVGGQRHLLHDSNLLPRDRASQREIKFIWRGGNGTTHWTNYQRVQSSPGAVAAQR